MKRLILFVTTAILLTLSAGGCLAGSTSSTLDRLVETHRIRIGYAADDPPFSYVDKDGSIIGYSIDVCTRVVDEIRQSVGPSDLKVDYVLRTPSDRFALLKSGSIDLECVASTNNAERRRNFAFSYSHFLTATQFVALKESNLRTIADLSGRTVTSTSGTVNIGQLNAVNRERGLHLAVIPSASHKAAFAMVTERRVSAFVMDGILLATMVAGSAKPDAYVISDDALRPPEPYGLMMRHDDIPLKTAVNAALSKIYRSGEIEKIYAKWFMTPIAPRGINLRIPLSTAMKNAFDNPVDITD
jgi:glutamate/aspartate transport system substrate-binding protein